MIGYRDLEAPYQRAQDGNCRDLGDLAPTYCIAKLAYAAGEDEAGDAAWSRFLDETDADERDQIEAQLDSDFPSASHWVSTLTEEAARLRKIAARQSAQRKIAAFIQQVMA